MRGEKQLQHYGRAKSKYRSSANWKKPTDEAQTHTVGFIRACSQKSIRLLELLTIMRSTRLREYYDDVRGLLGGKRCDD